MRLLPRLALLAGLAFATPLAAQLNAVPMTQGLAGAYLAGRTAALTGDHREAALQFQRVLANDPQNQEVLGNAILALAAIGDWDQAAVFAERLDPNRRDTEFADLIQQVRNIRDGNLTEAYFAAEQNSGAGPLIDPLLLGWLTLADGNMSAARDVFEDIILTESPLGGLVPYQLALALAAVGDFEGADNIFSGDVYGPLQTSARGVQAHAQIMVQLDRPEDALSLLALALEQDADQGLITLQSEIEADPARPYDFLTSPEAGMAEVFFSVARALGTDAGATLPLVYSRAARVIDPDHTHAAILAANLLSDDGQYEMAMDAYTLVPREDPLFVVAEAGRSEALFQLGRTDAAIEVLHALARDFPNLTDVHIALGDSHRRLEQFEDAVTAYDAAVALVDPNQRRNWFLFYARAISNDRSDNWTAAEADFRQALLLEPNQPNVLNYLGYSLVEQNRNLDEALDMIERAVAARPNSGYIVDSLAWVYYRLDRFDEAVAPMERAVELLPNDPILNDHLGDVYWMVGRFREAEFQWSRALSFEPDEADADRIRLKLEVGLDAVLEAEGESPEE